MKLREQPCLPESGISLDEQHMTAADQEGLRGPSKLFLLSLPVDQGGRRLLPSGQANSFEPPHLRLPGTPLQRDGTQGLEDEPRRQPTREGIPHHNGPRIGDPLQTRTDVRRIPECDLLRRASPAVPDNNRARVQPDPPAEPP